MVVYNSRETDFSHNGLAVLDNVIRCEVEEELNGFYGLELEYPIFDKKIEYLIEDNIIKVSTPRGQQLFRIYRKVKTMASVIYYARHIFYDLLDNFIESYRTGKVTGNIVLQGLLNNTQYAHNFKGSSDVNKTSDAFYVRKNPVESLIGDNENSFIRRWGGEILRDNFNVSILNYIGGDKGVTISYGKNLLGLEEDLDNTEVVTRIMPTGLTENDNVVMLEEKYINSPNIEKYPHPKIRYLHFGDIKVDSEKNITIEDVKKQLREKVQELYQIAHIDIPKTNYKVDFVELSKTEEYKNYSCLESVNLGDIVTVKHLKMGINIRQKVIKYKWDSILNKYLEIELGSFKENLATDFNNISNSIEDIKENIEENNKKFKSVIDKQDDRITLNVEEIDKTKAQIEITANSIINTVEDKESKLNSKIEQKADSISSYVNNEIDNCNSRISQTANEISSKVEKDGVISAINQSSERIEINASKIDLSGVATFNQLENNGLEFNGQTKINGGIIEGSEFHGGNIDTQNLSAHGSVWFYQSANVSQDFQAGYIGSLGDIKAQGDIGCGGNLNVAGKKNCIQNTKSYGWREINAYETCEYFFGDLGFGELKNGICKIEIDHIFSELVNLNNYYHVFLSKYGKGDIWVEEITPTYFIVKGTNDIRFSYEIKAKRRGYENVRLDKANITENDVLEFERNNRRKEVVLNGQNL